MGDKYRSRIQGITVAWRAEVTCENLSKMLKKYNLKFRERVGKGRYRMHNGILEVWNRKEWDGLANGEYQVYFDLLRKSEVSRAKRFLTSEDVIYAQKVLAS